MLFSVSWCSITFFGFCLAYVSVSSGLLSEFGSELISVVSCVCFYPGVFYVLVFFSGAIVFFLISSIGWCRFFMFLRDSRIILLSVCIIIVLGVLLLIFIVSIASSALKIAISSARLFEHLSRSLCSFDGSFYSTHTHTHTHTHRVSPEQCTRLREDVPYFKVYRYNPKHLCPKWNGYGYNGQRKMCSSGGSTHCTCQLTSLIDVCPWVRCPTQLTLAYGHVVGLYQNALSAMLWQCLPFMCRV